MKTTVLDFEVLKQPSIKTVTNLTPNGGFESGISEWALHGTGTTIATDATDFFVGSQCAKVVTPGTTNPEGIKNVSASYAAVTPLKLYIISVEVKAPAAQAMLLRATRFNSGLGSLGNSDKVFTGTGNWQQVMVSFTGDATIAFVQVGIYTGSTAAITFRIDAVQVEEANSIGMPSPYIDTNGSTTSRIYPSGSPSPVLVPGLGSTKAVTPATINASSTINDNVTALKRITPSSISATSVLSSNIVTRRAITPATVNAASTISGNIRALRTVLPSNIVGTSTLSANVVALRGVLGSNISALSSLSGTVKVLRAVLPAQINASSTISANVIVTKRITSDNISAISSLSGALVVRRAILPSNITATSTVAASITYLHSISANINAISTITSAVGVLKRISPANLIATSSLSGSIKRLVFVIGTNINATSTLSGNLNTARGILSANIGALSTITGQVRLIKPILPTNITIVTVLSAGVVVLRPITSGNINATSTILGNISKIIFHGPLITFDIEVGNRNWFASVTKQAWDASPTLPIRDWNVSV